MTRYEEIKEARQKEFNALPIFFAFSNEQFAEAMEERGLTMKDTDKVYRFGMGGFFLKEDKDIIHEYFNKPDPIPELMKDFAFAEEAFYHEMAEHEYHINWQGNWDVCNCFGNVKYTEEDNELEQYFDQLGFEEQTRAAFFSARKKFLKDCEANGWL